MLVKKYGKIYKKYMVEVFLLLLLNFIGPCIPLYTTTNSESSIARISFRELKFLTNNDVPELNEYLVIGINMI